MRFSDRWCRTNPEWWPKLLDADQTATPSYESQDNRAPRRHGGIYFKWLPLKPDTISSFDCCFFRTIKRGIVVTLVRRNSRSFLPGGMMVRKQSRWLTYIAIGTEMLSMS